MIIIMSVATQVDSSNALIRLFHPDNSHLFAAGKTSTNPSLFFFPQLARLQRIANRSYILAEKIITKLYLFLICSTGALYIMLYRS